MSDPGGWSWWAVAGSAVVAVVVVWLLLVGGLLVAARRSPRDVSPGDVLRLGPDVVRLVRRLAADADLPRGVRWRLWCLLGYLLLPVDLVPDFVPVVGYADDVVVLALTLRSVVRRAGPEALERHWPGGPAGLALLRRLAGLSPEA